MSVVILRPVYLKVVVTEQFKARRGAEIRQALSKLETVAKRLDYELSKAEARPLFKNAEPRAVAERLHAEKRRNEQAQAALARELERLTTVEVGSEYQRGVLQGTVEVEVGDDFNKLGACEIVVRDDTIVEIRDGQCPDECETLP